MIVNAADIQSLGTILGIWAHPDDESWTMAGVIAQAAKNSQRVVCVTATHGDGGKTADETRWPQARLAEIRTAELEAALKVLGVSEHHWLDYRDGQLKNTNQTEAVNQVAELISKVNPDTVFTFGPDGLTGHTDHIATFEWTKQALRQTGSKAKHYIVAEEKTRYSEVPSEFHDLIYFNIDHPNLVTSDKADLYYQLPKDILEIKIAALRAQPCQMNVFFERPGGEKFMKNYQSTECFMLSSDE